MKKIIKNKVYDTTTAKEVGEHTWSLGSFEQTTETLYQKKTGEFFIHGSSAANGKYARALEYGDGWGPGEDIIPLTYCAAREWAEANLTADEYESIFGEIQDDLTKSALTLYLPNSTIERIKRNATAAGIPLSAYIEALLDKEGVK